MKTKVAIFAALLCLTAPGLACAQVGSLGGWLSAQADSLGAGWREQQNEAQRGVREGRNIPLAQVLQIIRQRVPGRQLDAGLEQGPGGRTVYRVRWASDDGRRIDFIVDAQSGQILSGG